MIFFLAKKTIFNPSLAPKQRGKRGQVLSLPSQPLLALALSLALALLHSHTHYLSQSLFLLSLSSFRFLDVCSVVYLLSLTNSLQSYLSLSMFHNLPFPHPLTSFLTLYFFSLSLFRSVSLLEYQLQITMKFVYSQA